VKVCAEKSEPCDFGRSLDVKHLAKRIPNKLVHKRVKANTPEHKVTKFIAKSGLVGVTESEITAAFEFPPHRMASILSSLEGSNAIIPCGVEERRYVSYENSKHWTVQNQDCAFQPKPWVLPSGEVNVPVMRWMAESVLVMVMSKPGITHSDITKAYSFVLQPSLVTELVELLVKLGCLTLETRTLKPMVRRSPFEQNFPVDRGPFLLPAKDGLERFAEFTTRTSEH